MALGHNIMQFFMITKNQVKEKCFHYILYFKHQLKKKRDILVDKRLWATALLSHKNKNSVRAL